MTRRDLTTGHRIYSLHGRPRAPTSHLHLHLGIPVRLVRRRHLPSCRCRDLLKSSCILLFADLSARTVATVETIRLAGRPVRAAGHADPLVDPEAAAARTRSMHGLPVSVRDTQATRSPHDPPTQPAAIRITMIQVVQHFYISIYSTMPACQ